MLHLFLFRDCNLHVKIAVKESQSHYFALSRTFVGCSSDFYKERARKDFSGFV